MFGRPCTVPIALCLREGLVTPAEVRWLQNHTNDVTPQAKTSALAVREPMLLMVRSNRDQLSLVGGWVDETEILGRLRPHLAATVEARLEVDEGDIIAVCTITAVLEHMLSLPYTIPIRMTYSNPITVRMVSRNLSLVQKVKAINLHYHHACKPYISCHPITAILPVDDNALRWQRPATHRQSR